MPYITQCPRCNHFYNPRAVNECPACKLNLGKPISRLGLAKDFRLGSEKRILELKVETFNTLNHFNPGNPNTTLNLNFATGANTNAAFGTITGTQGVDARRVILSARFRF